MKLSVHGVVTYLARLPYPDGGHILQVIFTTPHEVNGLHQRLVEALNQLRNHRGGVMHVEKFEPHENRHHESEIRVLEGLELEVIDLLRMLGYGVEQTHDDPPSTTL